MVKSRKWVVILLILILISSLGYIYGFKTENVALIKVEGIITADGVEDLFTSTPPSSEIVEMINKAEDDENIDAIIIEINSPGGSPVASKEIVDKIKQTDKLIVSYIREMGASGGYWIASASDYIFADELSIVGSVGVNAAHLEFSELMERFNVSYVQLTGGKYKDIASPLRKMTEDEEERLNKKVNVMHEFFLKDVSESRYLTEEQIEEVKNADFYVGLQSKELGLIDEFGGKEEALDFVSEQLGKDVEIIEYDYVPSFKELFSSFKSASFSKQQILTLR